MFRSIRWTLQMWHAAILATVLIVFGWVVFYLMRVTTYQHIDAGLDRMADLVSAGLKPRRPFRSFDGQRPDSNAGSREALAARNSGKKGAGSKTTPAKSPPDSKSAATVTAATPAEKPVLAPPGEPPAGPPSGSMRRPRPLELNEDFPKFFEDELGTTAYFVVFWGDGHVLLKSPSASDVPLPELHPDLHAPPLRMVRQRGNLREIIYQRRWDYLLVGRSIESDVAALHDCGWLLAGISAAVLSAGLIGGFWFSGRAIKPIEAISA
ncbi:MAG TPA: hypothetical protein VEI07_17595, partial [Planctomycetaceae bacterium]|nr:hypothetical protein [Planctomycetaceae bacterium]